MLEIIKNNASWVSDIGTLVFTGTATVIAILGYRKAAERFFPKTKSGYYAVFLTNAQVYFGQITAFDANFIKLEDVYYLQEQEGQGELSLVKMGNELHGPQDVMHIKNSEILFWEPLKNDGKVVQAITEYKSQQV